MGRPARLAAEIPDISIPLARNGNSGMTVMFSPPGILSHAFQRRDGAGAAMEAVPNLFFAWFKKTTISANMGAMW